MVNNVTEINNDGEFIYCWALKHGLNLNKNEIQICDLTL